MNYPSTDTTPLRTADRFRNELVAWYRRHLRDLPWRNTEDAYRILVSEIMLQQTTVAAVKGYYERFLAELPTVHALADAEESAVLRLWAGLGYYRRARLLHSAAKAVVREHNGIFPRDVAALQKLPGVGRYTAGAVASFAFQIPAPIVEANSARVLARLFAVRGVINDAAIMRRLWAHAESLVPQVGAREYNYALMELGSLVCRPVAPNCSECPVSQYCGARAAAAVHEIPQPKVRTEWRDVYFVGLVARTPLGYLMRRIPAGEWHAGLWEFPKTQWSSHDTDRGDDDALLLSKRLGPAANLRHAMNIRYTVTHHRIVMSVWQCEVKLRRLPRPDGSGEEWAFVPKEQLTSLALGSHQSKIVKRLNHDDAN